MDAQKASTGGDPTQLQDNPQGLVRNMEEAGKLNADYQRQNPDDSKPFQEYPKWIHGPDGPGPFSVQVASADEERGAKSRLASTRDRRIQEDAATDQSTITAMPADVIQERERLQKEREEFEAEKKKLREGQAELERQRGALSSGENRKDLPSAKTAEDDPLLSGVPKHQPAANQQHKGK